MKFVDYYKILGVKKSASEAEIRKAYLSLAKQHHPDRGGEEQRMNRINEAYETLKDERARALYDEIHRAKYSPDSNVDSIFQDVVSDENLRQQTLQTSFKDMQTYSILLAVCAFGMFFGYAYTDSGIYVALLLPAIYAAFCLLRAFYHFCRAKITKRHKLAGRYYPPLQVVSFAMTGAILLVLISFTVLFAVASNMRNGSDSGVGEDAVYEEDIAKIESERNRYDTCVEEFSEITNQLNRLNQQSEQALSNRDTVVYNRLRTERENLVQMFEDKRNECSTLQDSYNKKLESYRKKVENQ